MLWFSFSQRKQQAEPFLETAGSNVFIYAEPNFVCLKGIHAAKDVSIKQHRENRKKTKKPPKQRVS